MQIARRRAWSPTATLKVVTKRAADRSRSCADLLFAFTVAKHVKSNAIVYAKGGATVGIGAGPDEPRRFRAHGGAEGGGRRRARRLERAPTQGSVAASDAFFPFADGLKPSPRPAPPR